MLPCPAERAPSAEEQAAAAEEQAAAAAAAADSPAPPAVDDRTVAFTLVELLREADMEVRCGCCWCLAPLPPAHTHATAHAPHADHV
jgi:hypothetical protein